MVTNPRTPILSLWDDGLIFGCDHDLFGPSALNPADGQRDFEALDEATDLLPINNSDSSATMVNHGIDLLTGDVLEGSAALGAGEARVLREEAA